MLDKWCPISSPDPQREIIVSEARTIFNSAALLARLMDDRELVSEIVAGFLNDFPWQLTSLGERIAAGDTAGTRAKAHAVKGAASMIGAERLQSLGREMEQAGAFGELTGCDELFQQALAEFEQFKVTVKEEGWVKLS